MPSGAKKRKAAKKKKENQPNSSSTSTQPHDMVGGDDVKHRDDKESDVGEVSSPASQDHHSQHSLLTEGEEEEFEKRENVSNLPSTGGTNVEVVHERNIVAEGTAIPVEKIEDDAYKKDEGFEHDEPARKSYDGGPSSSSSSGSSSSSDDESHGTKNGQAVVDISPVVVSVADTFSEEHVEAIESSTNVGAGDSVVENVPAVSEQNGQKKQSCIEDQVVVSEDTKDSQRDEPVVPSVDNTAQEALNLSYNAPVAAGDNGGDAEKYLGVTEPLLVPASHPVQTTSWKSCCGLFEVFTGSGR